MVEILQRDPPQKSHIVAEKIDDSTVKSECGYTFEQPGLDPIHTFTYYPQKPPYERRYNPPPEEGRCDRCPWDDIE